MKYKVKKATVEFAEGKMSKVTVWWEDGEETRVSYADAKCVGGYFYLLGSETLSMELLQQVCGYGQFV